MIVAGIGCRRGASMERIEHVLDTALAAHGVAASALEAIASAVDKSDEPGLRAVAERRRLPLRFFTMDDLQRVTSRVLTRSLRVAELKGVPSIAEAAALAAAGPSARLLGPRTANDCATCAFAVGGTP